MASQHIYNLCRGSATISSELKRHPCESPGAIAQRIYTTDNEQKRHSISADSGVGLDHHHESLDTASQCGQWPSGQTPSPLFLQAFSDSLACLGSHPMAGVVSPPLMGSYGTMPLTIVAPVEDVVRHNAHLIRNAKRHVFFATCVWSPSVAQTLIKGALIDLSEAAGQRGDRIVVKIMFDKAGLYHFFDAHQYLEASTYSSRQIGLPSPAEVPHLDMEVMSTHTMMLGTMHAKFCVVDGETATIMSNNVEDNPNLEMMTQVQGPIVTSIYDTALYTWNKAPKHHHKDEIPEAHKRLEADLDDMVSEMANVNRLYEAWGEESHLHAVNHQLNLKVNKPIAPTGPEMSEPMTPCFSTMTNPVPMALVSRPAYGACDHGNAHVPQNEAWLSLVRNAKKSIFIQTPDLNAEPLVREIVQALKRGVEVTYYVCFGYNDAGEMIPGQGGTNEQVARKLISSLPEGGPERALLHIHNYVAKDQDHPIHHSFRSRSCHVKLFIADESVGIQGSGNQDSQSWYHSQEVNIMVDSPEICTRWRNGVERNQNTRQFGACPDGVWREKDGTPGPGYSGDPGMIGGLLKGVIGMIQKMIHQTRGAKNLN